jgi:DNA-binding NtrC family response regulator
MANGLMSLAIVDAVVGNWSRADGLILRAREIYSKLGLSRQYVQATLNLGVQRLWSGHLSFAEEALREATRLSTEIGDRTAEASARSGRGLALVRNGRVEEARVELARAIRLSRRQASPRRLAIALEYTGELHIATRQFGRAAHALRRALAIANRIAPEGDIVPEVRRRQAEIALGLAQNDEALGIARDAEQRALRLGDRYERATTLRVQAQALRALQREPEAVAALRQGLSILDELGETFERDRFLKLIGEILPDEETTAEEPPAGTRTETARTSARSKGVPTSKEVRRALDEFGIVGKCRALTDLMRHAIQIAPLDLPILIQGETGTGKELLAQAIHKLGRPPKAPLIAFNCATCPPDLLDAELFGHSKGAYTGAHSNRLGLVRSAESGTLFLDEIGEMREESQARLLRLLDSGEVRPLGSDQSMRVKVRIIAATHADLSARIREQRFRQDLYFRLAGMHLILPPLRNRSGDVRELVDVLVREARETIRPGFVGFSDRVLAAMERYSWPGNVRQLKHEILRVAALAPEGVPVDTWTPSDGGELKPPFLEREKAGEILDDPERLRAILRDHKGQMADVARALGVSRGHLYRVLRRAGISVKEVRSSPPSST